MKSISKASVRLLAAVAIFIAILFGNSHSVQAADGKCYALFLGTDAGSKINLTMMKKTLLKDSYTVYPLTESRCKTKCKTGLKISDFEDAVKTTFAKTTSNDVSYVYFNGHSPDKGDTFGSFINAKGKWVYYPYEQFLEVLSRNIKGKIVLIVESCYSGRLISYAKACSARKRMTVFASSSKSEPSSNMYPKKVTGLITIDTIISMIGKTKMTANYSTFLSAGILRLYADSNKDGCITASELHSHMKKVMATYAAARIIYKQTPQFYASDSSLILFSKASIKLNKSSVSVNKGKTYQLKATIKGTSKKAVWTSSNTAVAKVSSAGKVTGVKAGTATITATVAGRSAVCKVTVKKPASSVTVPFVSPTKTICYTEVTDDYGTRCVLEPISSYIYIGGRNSTTKITDAYCSNSDIYVIGKPEHGFSFNAVYLDSQMTYEEGVPIQNNQKEDIYIKVTQNSKSYTLKCTVTFVKKSVISKVTIGGKDYTAKAANGERLGLTKSGKVQFTAASGFSIKSITVRSKTGSTRTIANGASVNMKNTESIYVEYTVTSKPANYYAPNFSIGVSDESPLAAYYYVLN